jgi:hypothetical protein
MQYKDTHDDIDKDNPIKYKTEPSQTDDKILIENVKQLLKVECSLDLLERIGM